MFRPSNMKKLFPVAGAIAIALMAWIFWTKLQPQGFGEGFASGNGRIEATEIDLATKYAGRVVDIFVREGDFVKAGQVLAQMQVDVLNAQRDEARAEIVALSSSDSNHSPTRSATGIGTQRIRRYMSRSPSPRTRHPVLSRFHRSLLLGSSIEGGVSFIKGPIACAKRWSTR